MSYYFLLDENLGVDTKALQAFEIKWLLEAIYMRYGYDFRDYASASLKRRILSRLQQSGCEHISEMVPKILHDPYFFDLFLKDMSITVTDMFRDPLVFQAIRQKVVPKLRTYPRINIWHAGCATGEEVYSLAILLHEEGLLNKSQIYATDYNNQSLEIARKGIYPAERIESYADAYRQAGGRGEFADYYRINYASAIMKDFLRQPFTIANHNLTRDQVFAEVHLVMCRNVLIYFNQTLQNRVLGVLADSLVRKGFLVLGDKETLDFSSLRHRFDDFDPYTRIYQKTKPAESGA